MSAVSASSGSPAAKRSSRISVAMSRTMNTSRLRRSESGQASNQRGGYSVCCTAWIAAGPASRSANATMPLTRSRSSPRSRASPPSATEKSSRDIGRRNTSTTARMPCAWTVVATKRGRAAMALTPPNSAPAGDTVAASSMVAAGFSTSSRFSNKGDGVARSVLVSSSRSAQAACAVASGKRSSVAAPATVSMVATTVCTCNARSRNASADSV